MTAALLLITAPVALADGARRTLAAAFGIGAVTGLTLGLLVGLAVTIHLLRATHGAVGRYQLLAVARILETSSSVHTLVHQIVRHAEQRIRALRAELHRLKEGQP